LIIAANRLKMLIKNCEERKIGTKISAARAAF
jgi:hypothetical protein